MSKSCFWFFLLKVQSFLLAYSLTWDFWEGWSPQIPFEIGQLWSGVWQGRHIRPGGTFPLDWRPHHYQILMGSSQRSSKASLGVLKDIAGWRGEIIYFKENKPQNASHWKVPHPSGPWRKSETEFLPHSQKFSKEIGMSPVSVQGGSAGHLPGLLCFMIDAPSLWLGGVGIVPSVWVWWGPLQALTTGLPSRSCSPICLWAPVTSGNSFLLLCSLCWVQLVSSLGQDGCGRRMKTVGIL